MYKSLIILGLAFTFAGCATNSSAPQVSSKANSNKEKVAKEEPKLICKRVHKVGTNFKTKQCWTAEEYAEQQKRDQDTFRKIQSNNAAKMQR